MEFNNHRPSPRELIKRCISTRKASPNGNMGYQNSRYTENIAANLIILIELNIDTDF